MVTNDISEERKTNSSIKRSEEVQAIIDRNELMGTLLTD